MTGSESGLILLKQRGSLALPITSGVIVSPVILENRVSVILSLQHCITAHSSPFNFQCFTLIFIKHGFLCFIKRHD